MMVAIASVAGSSENAPELTSRNPSVSVAASDNGLAPVSPRPASTRTMGSR
jgi:hypothetical protein